ncbi:PLP-dependent aminotransferase family protein [Mesorhizobium captivum]|uniref:aminotransferase-like domain-containing protein n=1 Tax=Mesorhizobium captivum TaxID=3072319 RepID=UPI002A24AC2A|nr:PLP-dependent aminotransferase family protein [Mesorhizobium sp. VK3C]MDX8450236.1 PLP-dependent aminotransferase family protein [Mesorhizobium sp. VK3C]
MDERLNLQGVRPTFSTSVDFGRNFPPPSPVVEKAIRESFSHLARTNIAEAIRFPRFTGTYEDREAGASWLSRRLGQKVEADRVVLANGSQSILAMLIAHFVKPGGVLLTEALTYPAIKPLSALFDVHLQGIPIDSEGIIPDALEEVCGNLKGNAHALYCMPTLHNPTSAVMSGKRRQEIAKIARQHNLAIFEDDIYGVLPQSAPKPLAVYAPERTWYILGLSKSLAAQLRIAYVVGPTASTMQSVFWPGVRTTNWMVAPIVAEIATYWLSAGLADEILDSVRVETLERRAIAAALLDKRFDIDPASYHLWIELPTDTTLSLFVKGAREQGVAVAGGDSFAVGWDLGNRRFRIGLGVPANQDALREGLSVLSKMVARSEQP